MSSHPNLAQLTSLASPTPPGSLGHPAVIEGVPDLLDVSDLQFQAIDLTIQGFSDICHYSVNFIRLYKS